MALLTTSNFELDLDCYPKVNANIQQPWDAADLYLIESALFGKQPALINDQWGVLTCFLLQQDRSVYSWSDSFCSQKGIDNNSQKFNYSPSVLTLDEGIPSFPKDTDSLWIQCPKSFDQLHWWLCQALEQLGSGIEISLAGMAKHLPVKWLKWLEQHNDDYQQHPITKKARLMTFKLGDKLPAIKVLKNYPGPDNKNVNALPGVFSRDHMDIGSRFFIQQISQLNTLSGKVIDLGCGNGLLSIACLHHFPTQVIDLILCDDSSLALQSAKDNLLARDYTTGEFHHTDALLNVGAKVDTILCNPPFHSGNRISTAAAERMFRQASKLLNKDGQLLVIANRHLPYAPLLKKGFKNIKQLNSDAKFVVYQCTNALTASC
ncbi:MAG: 23S rRNA (guanine1835-N2)-methyltransferase [Oleispira sp.]|jgi:23S rRNA (guanine1835-N2)-methyltransferase